MKRQSAAYMNSVAKRLTDMVTVYQPELTGTVDSVAITSLISKDYSREDSYIVQFTVHEVMSEPKPDRKYDCATITLYDFYDEKSIEMKIQMIEMELSRGSDCQLSAFREIIDIRCERID